MTCYPTQSHHPAIPLSHYPNNAERHDMKRQVSILKVLGLSRPGFEPTGSGLEAAIFRFPDLPKQEAGALLIQPPRLVIWIRTHGGCGQG